MKSIDNIYTLDGKVPLVKALPFGFQHILTMFVSNITPIMIMAGKCGFSQRNILIISLSMSIGIGFTQVPELFAIFPDLVKKWR